MFLLAAKCDQALTVRVLRLATETRQPTSLVSFKTSLKMFFYKKVFINSSEQVNGCLYFIHAHIYIYSYIFKMYFMIHLLFLFGFFFCCSYSVPLYLLFFIFFPSVKPFVTFLRKELYKSLLLLLPLLKCK